MNTNRLLHESLLNGSDSCSDRPAVRWRGGAVDYARLRQRVWRLLSQIRDRGCGKGDRIAILLPKSVEYIQAIFATLSAGAAYVPLDPGSPSGRIAAILADARPRIVVTTREHVSLLEAVESSNLIVVDEQVSHSGLEDQARSAYRDMPLMLDPDDLAAILYTSGSTGNPKGVMLSHRNIGVFVDWALSTFSLLASDRLLSVAPFHFDLSTLDLFATFRAEASVFLLDEQAVRFPAFVSGIMEHEQITVCYAVPTFWRLLETGGALRARNLADLRLVLFAGEVFPVPALRSLMKTLPRADYYNLYGPTETNVCTYYHLSEPPSKDVTSIPIGTPCEHLDVTICDDQGRVIEADQMGEICVTGPAVMSGYWGQPEATSKTRLRGASRTYKTGDLGQWVPGKNHIRFMGRSDHQVKIRGHRIELLEIEAVLVSHPGTAEAAVHFDKNERADSRLKAYVVLNDQGCDVAGLLEHCRKYLPPVAVPHEIELVADLPRTSTGKIDRRQLSRMT